MKKQTPVIATLVLLSVLSCRVMGQTDTADGKFHDNLLDNFVGKWTLSGTVHGQEFKNIDLNNEWVLEHQFLQIHEKGRDIVPWLGAIYESIMFIGYDHANKRYVGRLMNVFGADDQLSYLYFGTRNGNEIKLTGQFTDPSTGETDIEKFIWMPESKSWRFVSNMVSNGKEQDPYVDLKIIAAK
jgi:hypothetical protein